MSTDRCLCLMESHLAGLGPRLARIEARLTMLAWVIALQSAVTLALLAGTVAIWGGTSACETVA